MLTVYTDLTRRICRILSLEDKICFKAQSSFSETIVADYSDTSGKIGFINSSQLFYGKLTETAKEYVADPECPPLYKDGKDLEKKYQILQNMTGACGHMVAEMLLNIDAGRV